MTPEIGKTYEIRIRRREGYEYLGEQRTEADCIGQLLDGYWTFGVALPHPDDEGRGVGFSVHESDIINEAR